jgi:CheY-like chemotaxis protein
MLRSAGVEVLVADNGRQALDLLKAHPDIDLVLMDCYMPVMDGFAATRAIRSHRHFHALPVVAMTANVLPDDLLKCRGVGMNDHVGKPFLVKELFDTLERWIKPGRPLVEPSASGFAPFDET